MQNRTQSLLLAMTIGDGYVAPDNTLNMTHGAGQRLYCEYKAGLLGLLLNKQVRVHRIMQGPGKAHVGHRLCVGNAYFKLIRKWCYPNGKKRITRFVLDHIDAEGLAIWYMDNGTARTNLNKDGFVSSVTTEISICRSRQEADDVCEWFRDVHKVDFRPFKDRKKREMWSIRANTENSRYFAAIVAPFVVPPMLYKLAHVADLDSHERRAPIAQCANTSCNGVIYAKRRGGLCNKCYSRRAYRRAKQKQEAMR